MGFLDGIKDLFKAPGGGQAECPDCEEFAQRDYCWQEYLEQASPFPFGPPPYGPEIPPDELPEALKEELDFWHPYAVFKLRDGYRIITPGARTPSGLKTIIKDCGQAVPNVAGARFDQDNLGFKSRWFDIVIKG